MGVTGRERVTVLVELPGADLTAAAVIQDHADTRGAARRAGGATACGRTPASHLGRGREKKEVVGERDRLASPRKSLSCWK